MVIVSDILRKIPDGWSPRPVQEEIFSEIAEGLESGKRYFFINAPTGSGKSLVNITMARYLGSAYIMTPLKALQKQYVDDFHDLLVEVKGRSNYFCPDGIPCHQGVCVSKEISPSSYQANCGVCPWVEVLKSGVESPITLFNFHSYICQTRFANRFTDPRGCLVVDEAHNLIDTLRGIFDISIRAQSLEGRAIELPEDLANIQELMSWARVGGLQKAKRLAKIAPEDDESNAFRQLEFKLSELLDYHTPGDYLMVNDGGKYLVRRKRVGDFFKKYMDGYGEIKIFSSGTMLSPEVLRDYLGIPEEEMKYISIPWPMSPEQGPISTQLAVTAVTHRSLMSPKTIEGLQESVKMILRDLHPEDRGVIHCVSHALRDRLMEGLPPLFTDRLTENLEEFKLVPGKVLIGPAFFEGLDLFDDLCRFQILLKIPLPPITDPLVRNLGYDHPEIKNRVVTSIAQAYGRGIRSDTDYCTFYVLDRMIGKWRTELPLYIQRAFI